MCGLAGLIGGTSRHHLDLLAVARRMGVAVAHRGPDDRGELLMDQAALALAHHRLSIIDVSEHGRQPMSSASGRWVVCFNGEIYNHKELRSRLSASGHQFRGQSDTESLVEAIDAWGLEPALTQSNGMFAIAAYDTHDRVLWLARDRLGEKPLYWTEQSGVVAFGSQLAALRQVPGFELTVDRRALASVLAWSFVPHPHTVYAEVRQLAPGGMLRIEVGDEGPALTERSWWSLDDTIVASLANPLALSVDEAVDQLELLLRDAVVQRLDADVALGAFLSGGIDSSVVAALAQRALGTRQLTTFTVSMPELSHDESAPASAVARHLGTSHIEVELSVSEAIAQIPRLADIWDEPFADPSMLPTTLLCQSARQHLAVCLGGDGGDELFAGYNRHAVGAGLHDRLQRIPRPLRRGAGAMLAAASPALLEKLGSAVPKARTIPNLGDKIHKVGSLMLSETTAWETLAGIWPMDSMGADPYPPMGGDAGALAPRQLDTLAQIMITDTFSVLPDQMLVKVDRASMAAPIEVRVPFLDHRLLEWAWRLPVNHKASAGTGKVVLRRLATRLLNREITERPKMGFDPPLATWLRTDLREWAHDMIAGSRCADDGIVDRKALHATWTSHQDGRRNNDYPLWAILMLEQWLDRHHSH